MIAPSIVLDAGGKAGGRRETVAGWKKPLRLALRLVLPPALTPAATKKLIDRRNDRFEQAVREYVNGIHHHPRMS